MSLQTIIQADQYILFSGLGEIYLLAGILLAASLFFTAIYVGLNKNNAYLFFAAYVFFSALGFFGLLKEEMYFFLFLFTVAYISLLYFFLAFFDMLRSKAIAMAPISLIILPVAGIAFFGEMSPTLFLMVAWFLFALTLMICSGISLRAYNKQQYRGKLLFYTTVFIFLFSLLLISDSFFVSSITINSFFLILAVTYAVLIDIRKQNEMVRQLKNRSLQLENEMLKKSIQPHFLINTLTVLSEWIEKKPALAVRQIALLSKEFRYIVRVSGKKLIPVEEELKICRIHLDMFNAKQDRQVVLETQNIHPGTLIPPMTFHTLVENALTHSNTRTGQILFEQRETEHETQFRASVNPSGEPTNESEGLGISYIKSRLELAFPGKWNLTSGAKNNTWETLITIAK